MKNVFIEDAESFDSITIENPDNSQELRVLNSPGFEEILLANLNNLEEPNRFKISGSLFSSLLSNALLAYSARAILSSFNPPIAAMTDLSQTLKILLSISPLLPIMVMPIPITWLVHQCGAKYEILLMSVLSCIGMWGFTAVSASSDITTISTIDWRYILMFCSGFLMGYSSAVFHLIIDTLKGVSDKKLLPKIQMGYNFFVDSSSVTTPLIIYYLKGHGYPVPFLLLTGLYVASAYAALAFFQPSPYNQFKTAFPPAKAKILAIEYGQLEELIGEQDRLSLAEVIRENLRVLYDRRAIPLILSLLTSLSSSWFTRLILPQVLNKGFGFNQEEAIITSSIAFLIAILSRPVAEWMTKKWDKTSGGTRVHLLGCALTILGASLLTHTIPRWALFLSLASFNIGYGFNLVTPQNIAVAWSKPANENLKEFNPSTMFSLFGTIGTFGSTVLPFFLALMVDEGGQDGYQHYFFIIIALMALSAISMPIIDSHVRDEGSKSIFANMASFFTQVPSFARNRAAERNPIPAEPTKTYLEKNTFF